MFTLIIPAFLRAEHEPIPEIHTPALNDLCRFARFQAAFTTRSQLYHRYLNIHQKQPENQVYASPIWQQVGMNSVSILDGVAAAITADEAAILCAGLNDLYEGDCVFEPTRPDRWTLMLPEPPKWSAPHILDICGQLNGSEQASGADTREWLRLSAEIQMWLHSHALNQHRQPPLNGIWLWRAPECAPSDFQAALLGTDSVWADSSGLTLQAAPYDFAAWQRACEECGVAMADSAVLSEDFVACADVGDVWTYAEVLMDWETRWFAPLRDALFSGCLNDVKIVCERGTWIIKRKPQWAFWRKKVVFTGK